MLFSTALWLLAAGLVDARPRGSGGKSETPACATGMHIIGVRGTTEKPGHGALQEVVDGLKEMYPGSDDFAIDYPAEGVTPPETPGGEPKFNLFEYQNSEAQGYAALKSHLETYSEQCEETPIMLLGYSQGAHVIGDVLCGNRHPLAGKQKPAIDPYYTYNIKGAIHLGDPANREDLPWHQGNGTYGGIFVRNDYRACDAIYETFGQSWCDEKDFFCEFSHYFLKGSIAVHLQYVALHKDEILKQAKKLIDDAKGNDQSFKFVTQSSEL